MKKTIHFKKMGLLFLMLLITIASVTAQVAAQKGEKYIATWNSLKNQSTPQWLKDGKFGIYTHWGLFSVMAHGGNSTWVAHSVYTDPDSEEREWWEQTYGPLEKFGYQDLVPRFKAEKFNADEWADLFQKSGARFAGPVAEHHDGFAMWDTKWDEYNAAKMGPKRDVVGELEKAIKKRGMKFVTAFHHAENWFYFPTWDSTLDCGNPKYSGLYGPIHKKGDLPDKEFLDQWKGKIIEVIDKYDPDFVWFDFGLKMITDSYKMDVLSYFYNHAASENKEVVVTYKGHDMPPGAGLLDLELGQEAELTYYDWITDSSIDSIGAWGYVNGIGYKSLDNLIDNLVDRVSKNGYLLLNVGPKADGTIPERAKKLLLGMGEWLGINGDAIYGTTTWEVAGEGPTSIAQLEDEGVRGFNEKNSLKYTAQDIRFTVKDNNLYATVLAWPGEKVLIKSLAPEGDTWTGLYPSEITSITMLGDGKELKWKMTKAGLSIETPKTKPCDHAYVFKIERRKPF